MKKLSFRYEMHKRYLLKKIKINCFYNEIHSLIPESVIDDFIDTASDVADGALAFYNFSENHAVPLSIMCGYENTSKRNAIQFSALVALWDRLLCIKKSTN